MRRLINQHPGRAAGLALGVLPFIALLFVYVIASQLRLAENAGDKLLPSLGTIADTFHNYAFEADKRSGEVLFWYAYADNPETALLLRAAFLPGQVSEVQKREALAALKGALSVIGG